MPSLGNPLYKAVVKTTSGQEYDLYKLKVILDLTISDDPDSLAKEVSLTVFSHQIDYTYMRMLDMEILKYFEA